MASDLTYVFTWEDRKGRPGRFCRLNNSGWKAARRRAAVRYQKELGRPAPDGFRSDLCLHLGRSEGPAGALLPSEQLRLESSAASRRSSLPEGAGAACAGWLPI